MTDFGRKGEETAINSAPTVTYRFRCHQCPFSTEVRERIELPIACPMCGAGREAKDTSAVLKRGEMGMEDRRH